MSNKNLTNNHAPGDQPENDPIAPAPFARAFSVDLADLMAYLWQEEDDDPIASLRAELKEEDEQFDAFVAKRQALGLDDPKWMANSTEWVQL